MDRRPPTRSPAASASSHPALPFGAASSVLGENERSLESYAADVGRYALLSREDEQRLGAQIETGRRYIREALRRLPMAAEVILTNSETRAGEWLAGVRRKRQADLNTTSKALRIGLGKIKRALSALSEAVEDDASGAEVAALRRRLGQAIDAVALKPQGERELCAAMTTAIDAQLIDDKTSWGLSPARLTACRRRLRRGLAVWDAGRDGLAKGNLRLVIAVARRYANLGLPMGDLIQEGNLGLLHAIDKYDYRRGFKFSTYATWWIRQAVNRGVADKAKTIRIPVHISERRNKLNKAQRASYQELGRMPSQDELAERADLPLAKVKQIQEDLPTTSSLDRPVGTDESATMGDLVADEASPSALDATFEAQREALAAALLQTLPDRERRVIQMRFGIGLKQPYSLRQIAGQLRMSQESARQLELEGLRKLRETSSTKLDPDSL